MNWQAISFDWNQVRAFLATVEEGSFSAAARALKTTQPTVGRQVAELESALGVLLVTRNARGPLLTEAGRDLFDHVRAMGDAATLISMAAAGLSQDVSGEVAITASDLVAVGMLPAILAPLRQRSPGIRLRILASNNIQNLVQREADIAVRHIRPDQPELVARHVGDLRANLYASREYLDRAGRPRSPRDVVDHAFISGPSPEQVISPLQAQGIFVRPEQFILTSDSGAVVWEHLKSGYGISLLPEALCDGEPSVEKVFPSFRSVEFPMWLVAHRELHSSKKIRTVFDCLACGLAEAAGQVNDPIARPE